MALNRITADVEVVQSLTDKPAGTPAELKKKFDDNSINLKTDLNTNIIPQIETQLYSKASNSGWELISATLTYASADSPTFVINTSIDLTSVVSLGMKLKLTQTTVKYFIVTAITSGSITLYGGTDYILTNTAITLPYFSIAKAPYGFPVDVDKWSILITYSGTNPSKSSPTANTWYGGANSWSAGSSVVLVFPIGSWNVYGCATANVILASANYTSIFMTLSANNAVADNKFLSYGFIYSATQGAYFISFSDNINVTAKTPYYLMLKTDVTASSITLQNSGTPIKIKAVCAYL